MTFNVNIPQNKIKFNLKDKDIVKSDYKKNDVIIIVCNKFIEVKIDSTLVETKVIQAYIKKASSHKKSWFSVNLPTENICKLVVIQYDSKPNKFEKVSNLREIINANICPMTKNIAIQVINIKEEQQLIENFTLCLGAKNAVLPNFACENKNTLNLENITFHKTHKKYDLTTAKVIIDANQMVRYLSLLPANKLMPTVYKKFVDQLAKKHKWQQKFYNINELTKMKAGAFLAVNQGSNDPKAGIIHLKYRGNKKSKKIDAALVGKGVCFDTGGHNLKIQNSMFNMQFDMTGSAVALANFYALSQLKSKLNIDCWLAITMNDIGPDAYRPGDVITALNGLAIEVTNTDAEGRMILADTLTLASKTKPKIIIDYATLTGACKNALDRLYSGAFTNREQLNSKLIEIGADSTERVWPFPMDSDYFNSLKSDIADVKQAPFAAAGQITAAKFLEKFVDSTIPWVHIDLSATFFTEANDGLGFVTGKTSGFGVKFTLSALLEHELHNICQKK